MRNAIAILVAGLLWAITYGLVWAVAWFAFMRAEWYGALAVGGRVMPWEEIWTIWAVLNVPLGVATAAYFRPSGGGDSRANRPHAVVLVLWLPMTVGMTVWAWYESLSLIVIALDSAVNLAALALATHLARIVVRRQWSAPTAIR